MPARIDLGDLRVAVVRKEIKNLHLSVLPPEGRVRIAAPPHMTLDTIRVFVISRLAWIKAQQLVMQVRPGAEEAACRRLLDAWYRVQLRAALPAIVTKWQVEMRVRVGRVFVQRMKTKWGSCNPATGAIRLNTDLAKKPPECLEYIVVHEMVHLLEPTHNDRFIELMN